VISTAAAPEYCTTLRNDAATSWGRGSHPALEGKTVVETKIIVGGSLADDGAAFVQAWHRTERGERIHERVLAFESWESLAKVMTEER
jgi:hypothetical protein